MYPSTNLNNHQLLANLVSFGTHPFLSLLDYFKVILDIISSVNISALISKINTYIYN